MELVKGANVEVLFYDNGVWKNYGCARACTLTVNTSLIETTTTGSGSFTTFIPEKHSYTGTIDGLTNLDFPGGLSLQDLRQKQLAKVLLQMRFFRTGVSGSVYYDSVFFYITSSSDSAEFGTMNTFSISLQGTGQLVQHYTNPPLIYNNVLRYDFTATGGETSVTIPLLVGKDILDVNRDGISNAAIITSGSPVDKQCKYVSIDGIFEWLYELNAGEAVFILYQDI